MITQDNLTQQKRNTLRKMRKHGIKKYNKADKALH